MRLGSLQGFGVGAGKLCGMATIVVGEHGVRAMDLAAQRAGLVAFAEEMYGSLARCDQRAKGEQ
jgi:hypothetical protein